MAAGPTAAAAAASLSRPPSSRFALTSRASFLSPVTALLALAVALAGCASLPPPPPKPASSAATDTADTALGRLAAASLAGAPPGASGFRLLPTGDYAFDARVALARRAERTLDVQYYQIAADSVGLQLLRSLRDAARRGVRVRVLVDDLYTGGEDELFATLAALPNVELRLFNPFATREPGVATRVLQSLPDFGRINHRMHNKLFVADNRFSVSGGRNMADEYFMRSAHANFIDMDVLAAGPIVREQSQVFDRYWNSSLAWPIGDVVKLPIEGDAAARRFDELVSAAPPGFAPATSDVLGRPSVDFELAAGRASLVFAPAVVFADRPNKAEVTESAKDAATVTRSVIEELTTARSQILITSPYFIPGEPGIENMRQAIARGVRISVLTNGVGATDEPLVHFRYARYRRQMLRLGVELNEIGPAAADPATFGDFGQSYRRLHAKVAVIDLKKVFIGSMNFDARSAWSNTEAGLLIDSPELAVTLHELVSRDHGETIYRLRLRADGETIEWTWRGADGSLQATTDEPHSSWALRLKMFVLEPFAAEELL